MYNYSEKHAMVFEEYFNSITTYIHVHQPPVKERLEFIGTLIVGVLEGLKLTKEDKELYASLYQRLMTKKLSMAELSEDKEHALALN